MKCIFQFASLKFLKHSYANFMAQIVLPLKILPMHPTGNLSNKLCHTDIVHIMATVFLQQDKVGTTKHDWSARCPYNVMGWVSMWAYDMLCQ